MLLVPPIVISLFTIEYIVLASSVLASIFPFITISPLKSKLPLISINSSATTFLSNVVSFLTFKFCFMSISFVISKSFPIITLLLLPVLPIVIVLFTLVNIFLGSLILASISPFIVILPYKSNLPSVYISPVSQPIVNLVVPVPVDVFQLYIFKLSLSIVNTLLPLVSWLLPTLKCNVSSSLPNVDSAVIYVSLSLSINSLKEW